MYLGQCWKNDQNCDFDKGREMPGAQDCGIISRGQKHHKVGAQKIFDESMKEEGSS